jgi:hypothetical protein
LPSFNNIADFINYLAASPNGDSADAPIAVGLNIDLADTGGNGWADLLAAIQGAYKYVSLDLSACSMGGMEFDPGTANTGEEYVVSLTLPDVAISVKSGTNSDPTFRFFSSLKELNGEQVTSIGTYAFDNCTSLEEVSLPAATSINGYAFSDCTGLTSVSLPAATNITYNAFYNCGNLTSVNLPVATNIGHYAFYNCDNLTTVSLPAATFIGNQTFRDCAALTSVSLPAATNISFNAFSDCAALTLVSIPAATNINGYAFSNCGNLTSVEFQAATFIGYNAFDGCTGLTSVSLPAATNIGNKAFASTGTGNLTVTLGAAPPTLGTEMFSGVTSPKNVTVEVPSGAVAGYDTAWQNDFKGGNTNITLTIATY